jgi:hypothetical protein
MEIVNYAVAFLIVSMGVCMLIGAIVMAFMALIGVLKLVMVFQNFLLKPGPKVIK